MNRIAIGFVLLFGTLGGSIATAQHHETAQMEKPVALLPGLGTWRHPIATRNAEAQKFFDQGLTLLYGFNRYESQRSFRKAAELDPHAPMTFWGLSMAFGPYINMDMDPDVSLKKSCEASEAGLRVVERGSPERTWLEAAATRCPDFSDPARYVRAMKELAAMYPDDPDAQTLYAEALMLPPRWNWYSQDGKPAEGVQEAEHVLEQVLRRHPDHPGANHFYIHAVESSPAPERAVPSAQRLMGIVPAAGHIVHMPGHIWLVLGDFDNTVAVNERAAEVDRQYFAQTGVSSAYTMYYVHNLHFTLYARTMQGRVAATDEAARQLSEALKGMAAAMPEMAEVFGSLISFAKVRVQHWDKVLSSDQPKVPAAAMMWHYARAVAYAAKNDVTSAKREQAEFEALRKTTPRNLLLSNNSIGSVADLASAVLSARLESAPSKATPLWRRAVEMQDALVYDEPPGWYYPVRESLGAAILRSGDAPGAEAVFREGLRRSPNNGRMLFGLLESLKVQGKTDAAAWVQREFDAAWMGAEIKLRLEDL
jgi:tetratricopeptide (TPR) repeat protein